MASHILKYLSVVAVIFIFCGFEAFSDDGVKIQRNGHPRLILLDEDMKQLIQCIEGDSLMSAIHHKIIDASDQMIKTPLLEYKKKGVRLLDVSMNALKRIFYLSYAYRTTRNEAYARRAVDEMKNVCDFLDWNPAHFLDVAEMAMAVAIGYDWLFDFMEEDDRKYISSSLADKSLKVAINNDPYFYRNTNNWNSICNAGILYGALAVWDEYPEQSGKILEKCIESNPKALGSYTPDGAFPEGYGYWSYGTSFQVLLIDALILNFGHDFGLSGFPGFLESARFMQFMGSPIGKCFNFSDSSSETSGNLALWWFADKLNDNTILYEDRNLYDRKISGIRMSRLLPLLPIFASRLKDKKIEEPKQKVWHGAGKTPVFIYRSGWDGPDDTYFAIKGGSASTSHAHMDAGSFVYDFDGVRWAEDLGLQDYYSLESKGVKIWDTKQDGQRWKVLRMRNDYHNTLTVNGGRHLVEGNAKITRVFEETHKKGAVVDLTSVLGAVASAIRHSYLDEADHLQIEDSIHTSEVPINLMWTMVTSADASIENDKTIILTKDGKAMMYEVNSSVSYTLFILDNAPIHEYDAPNPNSRRIGFKAYIKENTNAIFSSKLTPLD